MEMDCLAGLALLVPARGGVPDPEPILLHLKKKKKERVRPGAWIEEVPLDARS